MRLLQRLGANVRKTKLNKCTQSPPIGMFSSTPPIPAAAAASTADGDTTVTWETRHLFKMFFFPIFFFERR
jgi:hypothetical protein